jgi:uncharacterized protein
MRIYAVADIHGRTEKLASIRTNTKRYSPDVVVVAGDITNYINAARVVSELASLSVPVLTVRGNTDLPKVNRLFDNFPNVIGLHLNPTTVSDSVFLGIDGTIPVPFRSRLAFREERLRRDVQAHLDENSILVAHPPPLGTLDMAFGRFHVGSHSVAQIVSESQPLLLICGHVHENAGTSLLRKTLVVNASMNSRSSGAIIDLKADRSLNVEMIGVDSGMSL